MMLHTLQSLRPSTLVAAGIVTAMAIAPLAPVANYTTPMAHAADNAESSPTSTTDTDNTTAGNAGGGTDTEPTTTKKKDDTTGDDTGTEPTTSKKKDDTSDTDKKTSKHITSGGVLSTTGNVKVITVKEKSSDDKVSALVVNATGKTKPEDNSLEYTSTTEGLSSIVADKSLFVTGASLATFVAQDLAKNDSKDLSDKAVAALKERGITEKNPDVLLSAAALIMQKSTLPQGSTESDLFDKDSKPTDKAIAGTKAKDVTSVYNNLLDLSKLVDFTKTSKKDIPLLVYKDTKDKTNTAVVYDLYTAETPDFTKLIPVKNDTKNPDKKGDTTNPDTKNPDTTGDTTNPNTTGDTTSDTNTPDGTNPDTSTPPTGDGIISAPDNTNTNVTPSTTEPTPNVNTITPGGSNINSDVINRQNSVTPLSPGIGVAQKDTPKHNALNTAYNDESTGTHPGIHTRGGGVSYDVTRGQTDKDGKGTTNKGPSVNTGGHANSARFIERINAIFR